MRCKQELLYRTVALLDSGCRWVGLGWSVLGGCGVGSGSVDGGWVGGVEVGCVGTNKGWME